MASFWALNENEYLGLICPWPMFREHGNGYRVRLPDACVGTVAYHLKYVCYVYNHITNIRRNQSLEAPLFGTNYTCCREGAKSTSIFYYGLYNVDLLLKIDLGKRCDDLLASDIFLCFWNVPKNIILFEELGRL
jgi:hypothetical protein